MNTMSAFIMGEINRGKEEMVFDWDKAAKLIKDSGFKDASAGLSGDWGYTSGEIFINGKPKMSDYTYLASTWATPQIEIDGEYYDCYRMESETPNWHSKTMWPNSALKIINKD
jgi:hypothetical protein